MIRTGQFDRTVWADSIFVVTTRKRAIDVNPLLRASKIFPSRPAFHTAERDRTSHTLLLHVHRNSFLLGK